MRSNSNALCRVRLGAWPERRLSAIRIAIDILGGEAAPTELVHGALDAVADAPSPAQLSFFGDANVVAPLLEGSPHHTVHTPRSLRVDDPLRTTLRGDIPSSMSAAIHAVARGDADAVVSPGSTGGLLALARHLVGVLPNIRRPAIAKTLGGEDGRRFVMLDLGANVGVGAEQLRQFARMGAAMVRAAGIDEPSTALLNIGAELRKGPATIRAAAHLLRADEQLNYAGFVEPDRMFASDVDVVVADGFAGNIALKAVEGAARLARHVFEGEFDALPLAASERQALARASAACDPQRSNGASLLGLRKVVVKSHGGADRRGFASAVRHALQAVSGRQVAKVAESL